MSKSTVPSNRRLPEKYDLWDVMKTLYRSEINCGCQSFWDGGFRVWLGDDMNGIAAEMVFLDEDFDKAAAWLHHRALNLYPNSTFAAFNPSVQITDGAAPDPL